MECDNGLTDYESRVLEIIKQKPRTLTQIAQAIAESDDAVRYLLDHLWKKGYHYTTARTGGGLSFYYGFVVTAVAQR